MVKKKSKRSSKYQWGGADKGKSDAKVSNLMSRLKTRLRKSGEEGAKEGELAAQAKAVAEFGAEQRAAGVADAVAGTRTNRISLILSVLQFGVVFGLFLFIPMIILNISYEFFCGICALSHLGILGLFFWERREMKKDETFTDKVKMLLILKWLIFGFFMGYTWVLATWFNDFVDQDPGKKPITFTTLLQDNFHSTEENMQSWSEKEKKNEMWHWFAPKLILMGKNGVGSEYCGEPKDGTCEKAGCDFYSAEDTGMGDKCYPDHVRHTEDEVKVKIDEPCVSTTGSSSTCRKVDVQPDSDDTGFCKCPLNPNDKDCKIPINDTQCWGTPVLVNDASGPISTATPPTCENFSCSDSDMILDEQKSESTCPSAGCSVEFCCTPERSSGGGAVEGAEEPP